MQSLQSFATTPALRSHLDTQITFMTELSHKIYDAFRKVSELNLHLTQQLIEDSIATSRQLMTTGDPVEYASIAMGLMQPMAERWRHYQQQLVGVLAGTQLELTRTAETHIPEASRTAAAMADELVRKASEETEKASERQRTAMERMNRPGATPSTASVPTPNGAHPG